MEAGVPTVPRVPRDRRARHHIEPNWSELRVKVPPNLWTRNDVGTIVGGSMYGAVGPSYKKDRQRPSRVGPEAVHVLMSIDRLGDDYVVWDEAAELRFEKPGESDRYATFEASDEEVDVIERAADADGSIGREYTVAILDGNSVGHATVEKTIQGSTDEEKQA